MFEQWPILVYFTAKGLPEGDLASASTLSESVVRTLRGGEGLPKMFCLVASSPGHLRSQCSIVCGSSLQSGHRGVEDIGVGFQQRSLTGSYARKEDRIH